MKKLFFKRHIVFFVILAILLICQIMIFRNCLRIYNRRAIQQENIKILERTLLKNREGLPENHIQLENNLRQEISKYKNFISNTWGSMIKLPCVSDTNAIPQNHVSLFFEISDYLRWARESCDAFGVEFGTCSFGFSEIFEKDAQPQQSEIYDIHQQKEHLKLLISCLLETKDSYLKIMSVERGDDIQSAFFRNDEVFTPETKRLEKSKSYVYKIKFSTFTNGFRSFLKNLYTCEIPLILRKFSVQPNYTLKLNKPPTDQMLEGTPSIFSITIEVLDIPEDCAQYVRKNAALNRKILYETAL